MAKSINTTILSSLNKNVSEINETQKKRFGSRKVLMPNGNDEERKENETELIDKELTLDDFICGTLSALVYGKKSIKDPKRALTLITGENTLFKLINEIHTVINDEYKTDIKGKQRKDLFEKQESFFGVKGKSGGIFNFLKDYDKTWKEGEIFKDFFKDTEHIKDYIDDIRDDINEAKNGKQVQKQEITGKIDFDGLNGDTIQKLSDLLMYINKDLDVNKLILVFDKLEQSASKLQSFATALQGIDWRGITKLKDVIKEVRNLIIMASAVLVLASLTMRFVKWKDILKFTGGLTLLISGTLLAFKLFAPKQADAFKDVTNLGKFIALVGGTLMLAGIVVRIVKMEDLKQFTNLLITFIWMLTPTIVIIAKFLGKNVKRKGIKQLLSGNIGYDIESSSDGSGSFATIVEFGKFIALVGGTLLFAGIVVRLVKMEDLITFSGLLIAFVFALTPVIAILGKFLGKKSKTYTKRSFWDVLTGKPGKEVNKESDGGGAFATIAEFGKFIALLGFTLLLGSIVMKIVDLESLFMFGVVLTVFVTAIMIGLGIASRVAGKNGIKTADKLGSLVTRLGIILLIGGLLFTLFPQLIPGVILFGAVLALFVLGIGTGLGKLQKFGIMKLFAASLGLLMLTMGIAATLLFASNMIAQNPMLLLYIVLFAGISLLYTWAMIALMKKLADPKLKDTIGRATFAILGIGAFIIMFGYGMKVLADVANSLDGIKGLGMLLGVVIIGAIVITGLYFLIKALAKFDKKDLLTALLTVGLMVVIVMALGAMLFLLSLFGAAFVLNIPILIGILGCIAIMALVSFGLYILINALSTIPRGQILTALIAVAGMALFALVMGLVVYLLAEIAIKIEESQAKTAFILVFAVFEVIIFSMQKIITTLGLKTFDRSNLVNAWIVLGQMAAISAAMGLVIWGLAEIAIRVEQAGAKLAFLEVFAVFEIITLSMKKLVVSLYDKTFDNMTNVWVTLGQIAAITTVMGLVVLGLVEVAKLLKDSGGELQLLLVVAVMEAIVWSFYGLIRLITNTKGMDPQKIAKAQTVFIMIGGLALAMTAVLLGLATVATMLSNDAMLDNFVFVILGMIVITGVFTLLVKFLGKIDANDLIKGELALAGIVVIVGLATGVMFLLAMVTDKVGNNIDTFERIANKMMIITGVFGVGVVVLGALQAGTAGVGAAAIWLGVAAMVGIEVAIAVAVGVMYLLAEVNEKIDKNGGIDNFERLANKMMVITGIFTAGVVAIGGLICTGIGAVVIAAGIAALVGIAINMVLVAGALALMADSLKKIDQINPSSMDKLIDMGTKLAKVVDALSPIVKMGAMLPVIALSLKSIMSLMEDAMVTVAKISALEIEEKDLKGNVISKRHLTKKDFTEAANNTKELVSILGKTIIKTYDRNPEIFDTDLFGQSKFSKVIRSLKSLSPLIMSVSKTVSNVAKLVVPADGTTYDKWGIPKSYRRMDKSDFRRAAENVSELIRCMVDPIMERARDEEYMEAIDGEHLFASITGGGSKVGKIVRGNIMLGNMILKISKAVQQVSKLLVPKDGAKFDKWGVTTDLEPMKVEHFTNASNNVIKVMETFYIPMKKYASDEEYMSNLDGEWFGAGVFGGGSKFGKIIRGNMKLASLITTLAAAVQKVGKMLIPKDNATYDEWGQTKDLRPMKEEDFRAATRNTLLIMRTLGDPIMELARDTSYMEMMGDGDSLFSDWFGGGGNYAKVIRGNMKLAQLITTLAKAVHDVANLNVATGWKVGDWGPKATGYEKMDAPDFDRAAKNTLLIVKAFYNGLKPLLNDSDYMKAIDSTGMFGTGDSDFEKIINANLKLSKLISELGKGVNDFANLKVATGYDKEGKPISYRQMSPTDFANAASAVSQIVECLGKGLINSFNEHKDWFEDGEDSEFSNIIKGVSGIGNLLSNIAAGIQAFAELRIPSSFDSKTGEPKDFIALNTETFTKTADNIKMVVMSLANGIMDLTKDPEFNKFFGENSEDNVIFTNIISGVNAMSEMLSTVAESITSYAELKFPTGFNADGSVKGYREMQNSDFEAAGTNINTLVSTLFDGIKKIGDDPKYEELMKLGSGSGALGDVGDLLFGHSLEDSKFGQIIRANLMMSEMLETIADTVQHYASLQIPTKIDPKTGNVLDQRPMKHEDFVNAGVNVGLIITTLGQSLLDTYSDPKYAELWEVGDGGGVMGFLFGHDSEDTIINRIIKANMNMGQMLEILAKAVQTYASLTVQEYDATGHPIEGKFIQLSQDDFLKAGTNVGLIITTLGTALKNVYETNKDMFEGEFVGLSWGFGLIKLGARSSTSPIDRVINAVGQMSNIITSIANAVAVYASGSMPTKFDSDGKPTEWVTLDKTLYDTAGTHIGEVLTALGSAIINTYYNPLYKEIWGDEKYKNGEGHDIIGKVMDANLKISKMVWFIAHGVNEYAKGSMVLEKQNSDGVIVNGERISMTENTYQNAAKHITTVITTLGKELIKIAESDIFKKYNTYNSPLRIVGDVYTKISGSIHGIAKTITEFATGLYIYDDGKETKTIKVTEEDRNAAIRNIKSVLTAIGEAVVSITKNEELFDADFSVGRIFTMADFEQTKAGKAIKMIEMLTSPIATIAKTLILYADEQFEDNTYDSNGNLIHSSVVNIGRQEIINAKQNIKDVMSAMIQPIHEISKGEGDFGKYKDLLNNVETTQIIADSLANINNIISGEAKTLKTNFVNNKIENIPSVVSQVSMMLSGYKDWVKELLSIRGENTDINQIINTIVTLSNNKESINALLTSAINEVKILIDLANSIQNRKDSLQAVEETITSYVKLIKIVGGYEDSIATKTESINIAGFKFNAQAEQYQNKLMDIYERSSIIKTALVDMAEGLDKFIDIQIKLVSADIFKEGAEGPLSKMGDDITSFIKKTNDSGNNTNKKGGFADFNIQFEKYVKTVNSVNPSKINSLNQLASTVNKLADKLGNVDKFTKTLANEINKALTELAKQLEIASKSIEKAEELQEKRHKLIDESTEKIRAMLQEDLTVQIQAPEMPQTTMDGTTTDTSITGTSATPPASGGTGDQSTPKSDKGDKKKSQETPRPTSKRK